MNKKVTFGARPAQQGSAAGNPDEWVKSRQADAEPAAEKQMLKRLTIDLPADLHARVKAECALKGVKMVDEVRTLLEQRFPPHGKA